MQLALLCDLVLEIPTIGVLHQDAQLVGLGVEERALILDDGRDADRCQESDLVKGALSLLLVEPIHEDGLEG